MRNGLRARDGDGFRAVATVERFGSRRGYNGHDEATILLTNIVDAATDEQITDHLWFKAGRWCASLRTGDRFAFDARAARYEKGYRGQYLTGYQHRRSLDLACPCPAKQQTSDVIKRGIADLQSDVLE